MTPTNFGKALARRQRSSISKRAMREPKSLVTFEQKAKVLLRANPAQLLVRAKTMMYALGEFKAEQDKVLVVFPMTAQGGNFYFAQGLFKVLAPKVRVVSLLTTGHPEYEKTITNQFKNLLRGRSKVIVFDDRNLGHTELNIRTALTRNGISRENISYHESSSNPLGSKMSALITRKNKPSYGEVELMGLNDSDLIKLMYYQLKGLRKNNTTYSNWLNRGKYTFDIFEHVLDKMHADGLLTEEVISNSGLELYNKVGKFDPIFVDKKSQMIVSVEASLKRVFEVIPKEKIDKVVRRTAKTEAKLKRIQYLQGIAAAKDLLKERGTNLYA